ncbi:DUF5959 family protein [Streptomyces sp. NPDC001820]|uniref:DUF5959 family protein n=1 Tax=Streptomyces sp. NPDC001820 TaxID=3364613 RepID=UPI0036B670AD
MASEGPIDLISLEGEGNRVIVRITGRQSAQDPPRADALVGEIIVDTAFVRGSIATSIFPEDLTEWQEALDTLDGGQDVSWRENKRAAEMFIELDPDGERAHVTVADRSMSLTTVTVAVAVADAWFDDAYHRLDQVLRAWPLEGA